MSKKIFPILFFFIVWLLSFSAFGQVKRAQIIAGMPTEYVLKVPGQADSGVCNVRITIDGSEILQHEVQSPDYEAKFILNVSKEGPINIQWDGKTKFRGFRTVSACSGSGVLRETVAASADLIREKWVQRFAKLNPQQAECVRLGLHTLRIKFESTDPEAQLSGPDAPEVKVVYEKCDQFVAKPLKTDYDCMVGTVSTKCSEQYYEDVAGQRSFLTPQEALIAHFEGRTLKKSGSEVDAARLALLSQEKTRREKESAAIALKREQEAAEKAAALTSQQTAVKSEHEATAEADFSDKGIPVYLECGLILDFAAKNFEHPDKRKGSEVLRMAGWFIDFAIELGRKGEVTAERIQVERERLGQAWQNADDLQAFYQGKATACVGLMDAPKFRPFLQRRLLANEVSKQRPQPDLSQNEVQRPPRESRVVQSENASQPALVQLSNPKTQIVGEPIIVFSNSENLCSSAQKEIEFARTSQQQGFFHSTKGKEFYIAGTIYLVGCEGNVSEQRKAQVSPDPQEARFWFDLAAEAGNIEANHNMGWLYQNGLGVQRDLEKARTYYLRVINSSTASPSQKRKSMDNNGLIQGLRPVPQTVLAIAQGSKSEDRNSFDPARLGQPMKLSSAEMSCKTTFHALSSSRLETLMGYFTWTDENKALNRRSFSADFAQIGVVYLLGCELPADYLDPGMRKIYDTVYKNMDIKPDFDSARYWLEAAAKGENILALHNLGWMYQNGIGYSVDKEKARTFYLKVINSELATPSQKKLSMQNNDLIKSIGN
jgi:TPR repeat protein